jgi:hypothetical protein
MGAHCGGAIHAARGARGRTEGGWRCDAERITGVPPATSPTKVGAEHTRTPLLRSPRGIKVSLAAIVRCEQARQVGAGMGASHGKHTFPHQLCRSQLAPCPIPHHLDTATTNAASTTRPLPQDMPAPHRRKEGDSIAQPARQPAHSPSCGGPRCRASAPRTA